MTEEKFYKNEHINYSNYKVNDPILVKRYLGEQENGIINLLAGAQAGTTQLLIAPTGSGKTNSTINILKKLNIKSIFIVPNATNVEQIMKDYDIPGAYGDLSAEDQLTKGPVVAMTWDKFTQLKDIDLSEYIAIVDEIHQTFTDMYREKKIKGLYDMLPKCKGRVDITATPNKLDFGIYEFISEYKQEAQTKYKVKLYSNINDDLILDIINKSNKAAVLKNDTRDLELIKLKTDKKADVICSDTKDNSKTYFEIVNNSTMKDIDVLLNTSVIVAGVNIYEPNITDVIVIGIKDIATIKQYVARFRDLKEVNVHIFNNNYNQDISNTYEIEWRISQYINKMQERVDKFNEFNKLDLCAQTLGFTAFKLENSNDYYYDEESKEYKVNTIGIRNKCYMEYYKKADILSFKELLMEYFNDIEIIQTENVTCADKKNYNKYLKEVKKEAMNRISENIDIIVGANELIRNKTNSKLDKYFFENKLDKEKILEQLNEKDIPNLINIAKLTKTIDLYTTYVVKNSFSYGLSWALVNSSEQKRKQFIRQMNVQVMFKLQKQYPQIINNNKIENRIYNILMNFLKPGLSFTDEHLEILLEELLSTRLNGVNISKKEFRNIVNAIFLVDNKQHKKGSKVSAKSYIFINNIIDFTDTPLEKMTRVYTIKRHKKIADIAEDHQLSEIDAKVLKSIIDKRYKNIINSNEAQELLNIEQIFAS